MKLGQRSDDIDQHLRKEAMIWKQLRHENIAQFYGVSFQLGGRPAIVMKWYQKGTATEFLKREPPRKRFEVVIIHTLLVLS